MRLVVMGKLPFVEPESAGVIVAPSVDQACRMFDVQHLVVQNVLHKPLRDFGRIERFADRDAVVNVIMMTKDAPGPAL